jgi:2-isopropylmalate synthase
VNGIGERAGNASLEEIVMALKTRKDFFGHTTRVRTKEIIATSKIVSGLTGLRVQRNKAIVGENAFAHESGVHQDGVLKESTTYEIMKPEEVGLPRTKIVLGKLSGRHAFKRRVKALGYELPDEELEHTFQQFKLLADKKKEIYDQDIEALIQDEKSEVPHIYELDSLSINCGPVPTASVRLRVGKDKILDDSTKGDGPIDAIFKTIDLLTGIKGTLLDYSVRSVTGGKDALGEASVEVKVKGNNYRGRAVSTDTIEASAKAYLNAINRVAIKHRRK